MSADVAVSARVARRLLARPGMPLEKLSRVLVATDFSSSAREALDAGLLLAAPFGAEVTLLHVFHLPAFVDAADVVVPFADLERRAGDALRRLAAEARLRYPKIEPVILEGKPWERIVDHARTHAIDLVVMGTHGRHGVSRLVLGSVADRVVRMSPAPVLTLRSVARPTPT